VIGKYNLALFYAPLSQSPDLLLALPQFLRQIQENSWIRQILMVAKLEANIQRTVAGLSV